MIVNDGKATDKACVLIADKLRSRDIDCFGFVPFSVCDVLNPKLLPDGIQSVIMIAVPYDVGGYDSDGVSKYAHVFDYHLLFSELFRSLIPDLESAFPGEKFYGFSDHSPINEKKAASKAGLGRIGRNSLLIHPVYGSYIFIGAILTSMRIECEPLDVSYCLDCGECVNACPGHAIRVSGGIDPDLCLSAVSQRRHLTPPLLELLKKNHIAWGCDVCQSVCPLNRGAKNSSVPFFCGSRHGNFTSSEVSSYSDDEFRKYAFSWRGRKRIIENLKNLEESDHSDPGKEEKSGI